MVLGWDDYQNPLAEISSLIGKNEESLPGAIVGIPVTTTDSPQEAKVLPKNLPFDLQKPLWFCRHFADKLFGTQ